MSVVCQFKDMCYQVSLERAESVQLFNVRRQVVAQYGRVSAETTFAISCSP